MPSALRGIALILTANVLFVCMNSAVKHLAASLPMTEIVWARTLTHVLFVVALFAPSHGGWRLFVTRRPVLQISRSLLLLVSTMCFFTALRYVPLADATAVSFTSPFLVAMLAGPMLGERVGTPHWLAIAVGFAGALLVIRPGGDAMNPYMLFVLGNAVCYATYQILTRRVGAYDRPETSVTYSALVGTIALSFVMPAVWRAPGTTMDWVLLAAIGLLGGLGHYCVARALVTSQASVLAPFYYAQLLGAAVFGYLIFGDVPSAWTWAGAALIVVSGVGIAWWEAYGRAAAPPIIGGTPPEPPVGARDSS